MGRAEAGLDHDPVRRLHRLRIEVADDDRPTGGRALGQPGRKRAGLPFAGRLVHGYVVEVGHDHREGRLVRHRHEHPERRSVPSEVQPFRRCDGRQRLPNEKAVAVPGPAGPGAVGRVVPRSCRADDTILVDGEDAFLEPEEVGLERSHVGQEQGQALRPAVGDVADVEGGDVQVGHGLLSSQLVRAAGSGR